MTAIHEPGDVWHIGWDWHADMWYVEPPFDFEFPDGEPMKWFHERSDAFEEVDKYIREQPVQESVVEQMDVPVIPDMYYPDEGTTTAIPYIPHHTDEGVPEPVRELVAPVRIPTPEEAQTDQERRLAAYNARVGLK